MATHLFADRRSPMLPCAVFPASPSFSGDLSFSQSACASRTRMFCKRPNLPTSATASLNSPAYQLPFGSEGNRATHRALLSTIHEVTSRCLNCVNRHALALSYEQERFDGRDAT